METLDFVAIATIVMPTLTHLIKTYVFKTLEPRIISGIVSFVLATVYAFLITYTPQDFLIASGAFFALVFATGTALYKVQKPSKK